MSNEIPKWKQDRCVHCTAGLPLWGDAVHFNAQEHDVLERYPKCTAPSEKEYLAGLKLARAVADSAMLDWLNEQITDTIYLDDGRLVDVKGNDIRAAIRAAMEADQRDTQDVTEANARLIASAPELEVRLARAEEYIAELEARVKELRERLAFAEAAFANRQRSNGGHASENRR